MRPTIGSFYQKPQLVNMIDSMSDHLTPAEQNQMTWNLLIVYFTNSIISSLILEVKQAL